MVVWMVVEWIHRKKPSAVGLATGAVAGLAAITPAAGYVPPWAALVIGAAAGGGCYEAVQLKYRLRYDDALDVVGVHMVAGVIGLLLISAFASSAVNAGGVQRGLTQLGRQLTLVAVGFAYPFVMTIPILWLVDKLVGLRVDPGEQALGLDVADYGEMGYMLDFFAGSPLELGVDTSRSSRER
jgi:Amt family ammonium transporter